MGVRIGLAMAALGVVGFGMAMVQRSPQVSVVPGGYAAEQSPKRKDKVVLTDAQWRKKLTPEQYRILRGHGTEAAFCGVFYDHKADGTYFCAGCDLPLFKSDAKFDSGTGWPSFFQPVGKDSIWTRTDRSYGMERQEVLCARCDGHLGHVFNDAPQTKTGLRFCMNSEALIFRKTPKTTDKS